jgi:biopolymer transport protein ExbB
VIGLLAGMLVLSVAVMLNKARVLMIAGAANRRFLGEFQARPDEMLDPAQGAKTKREYQRAPLYRLCVLALRELQSRLENYERRGKPKILSPQSLSAIKAVVDAGLVRESDTLNEHMVLLTIAISGGPFLGLLGTVTGVMITFAAIAAVGEVNVNSIAPGIAAALVATVAGLAVAIPSLFGYNYLASRVRKMTSEMAMFSDELITRLAETYSD